MLPLKWSTILSVKVGGAQLGAARADELEYLLKLCELSSQVFALIQLHGITSKWHPLQEYNNLIKDSGRMLS